MDSAKFLRDVATTTLYHAAQFAAGGALAVMLCALARGRPPRLLRRAAGIPAIALLALCGSALPLGSYGILPLVVVLGAAGLSAPASTAFLVANRFFTMLVPSSDPSFIWRTGYGRPILAVAAGILAGVLLLFVGKGRGSVLRSSAVQADDERPLGPKLAAGLVGGLAWKAAIALVVGVILQAAFQGCVLREIVTFLFTSPATSPVASFFAQRNVVGPLFLLGTWCITVMLDFVGLSALALVLKPKGLLLYVGYCAALAAVLCSSALLS